MFQFFIFAEDHIRFFVKVLFHISGVLRLCIAFSRLRIRAEGAASACRYYSMVLQGFAAELSGGRSLGGLSLARMFVRRRAFSASLTKHPAFAGRRTYAGNITSAAGGSGSSAAGASGRLSQHEILFNRQSAGRIRLAGIV